MDAEDNSCSFLWWKRIKVRRNSWNCEGVRMHRKCAISKNAVGDGLDDVLEEEARPGFFEPPTFAARRVEGEVLTMLYYSVGVCWIAILGNVESRTPVVESRTVR